jgi:cytochrome oxidase Cu insertion factor (SCO1/SenC/PrrC family)
VTETLAVSPPTAPSRRWRHRRMVAFVAPLVVIALAAGALVWHPWRSAPALADLGAAPSYRLIDQNNRVVTSAQFSGKLQVVSFLFPFCTTYCPYTTHQLATLQQRLETAGLADRVQFVAFNLGPGDSTPADMATYLRQYGVDPADARWSFLTGTPNAVATVVREGFGVRYDRVNLSDEPAGPSGTGSVPVQPNALAKAKHVDYDIVHNEVIDLVTPDGHIRGTFDGVADITGDDLYGAVTRLLAAS